MQGVGGAVGPVGAEGGRLVCVGMVQERAGETGLGRNEESEPGVG